MYYFVVANFVFSYPSTFSFFFFFKKYGELLRLPFDWKNPIGYSFTICLQIVTVTFLLWFLASLLSLALGNLLFIWSFIKEWKCDLHSLNEMLKTEKFKADILKELTEFIRAHSNIKELSKIRSIIIFFRTSQYGGKV